MNIFELYLDKIKSAIITDLKQERVKIIIPETLSMV